MTMEKDEIESKPVIDQARTCDVCGAHFTLKKNLLRHRRMKHGLNIIYKEDINSKKDGQLVCSSCRGAFSLRKNLLRHIRTQHGASLEQELALSATPFECHSCGFKSSRKDLLRDHIVRKHTAVTLDAKSNERSRCPLCGQQGFRNMLVKHFERDHNIEMTVSKYEFETEDEFSEWKSLIEKENANEFTKIYHYTAVDGGKFELYRCHRDGFYKGRGRNLRRRTDSNKIGGHCPSALRVRSDPSGKVSVSFCRTHVGHMGEEGRLRSIKREKRQRLREERQRLQEQRLVKKRQQLEDPKAQDSPKFRLMNLDDNVAHEIIVHDVDLEHIQFHYELEDETKYSEELIVPDLLAQPTVLKILAPDEELKFDDLERERRRLIDVFSQIVTQADSTEDLALVEDSMNSLLAALQERQSAQFQRQFSLTIQNGS